MPISEPAQSGWIVSPSEAMVPYVEAWKNVLSLGEGLDDARLIAEFGSLSGLTSDQIPIESSGAVEAFADVRVRGESETLTLRVFEPTLEHIRMRWGEGRGLGAGERGMEIVGLRVRRYRRM